jgi:hypothetical protein
VQPALRSFSSLGVGLLTVLNGFLPTLQEEPGAGPSDSPAPLEPTLRWSAPARPWSVTALIGQGDDSRFVEILQLDGGDMLDTYIGGFAVNRHMVTMWDHLHWEIEGSTYGHWGIEDHFEFNAAVLAR